MPSDRTKPRILPYCKNENVNKVENGTLEMVNKLPKNFTNPMNIITCVKLKPQIALFVVFYWWYPTISSLQLDQHLWLAHQKIWREGLLQGQVQYSIFFYYLHCNFRIDDLHIHLNLWFNNRYYCHHFRSIFSRKIFLKQDKPLLLHSKYT